VGLLLERELIEEAGKLAVPGRPTLFRTTKNFLRSFGLTSLEELPELPDSSQEGSQMTLELEAEGEHCHEEHCHVEHKASAGHHHHHHHGHHHHHH
jgi:segregation and condensation protein B